MNHTKNFISEIFTQLLDEKPINKITVKDIADRCGINRNTFYYHFRDIPDLCEFICRQRIDELIQNHCRPESPLEAIMVTSDYFTRHKTTLLHIYRALPREVFLRYMNQLAFYLIGEYLDTAFGPPSRLPDRRALLARYYKCVLVGILLDWLDADMSYDLSDMAVLFDRSAEAGNQILKTLSQPTDRSILP